MTEEKFGEWLPIESAPRDRARVLVWTNRYNNGFPVFARWDDDRYAKNPKPRWISGESSFGSRCLMGEYEPTHWMPLPTPPKEAE